QAEDGIRHFHVTGVQTCALPISSLDDSWRARMAAEASRGRVLRYVVSATPRRVTARLVAVPATSPMGAAAGTRNIITFTSNRYQIGRASCRDRHNDSISGVYACG